MNFVSSLHKSSDLYVRGRYQPTGADSNPASWALPTAEQWKVARMQSLKKKTNIIKASLIA